AGCGPTPARRATAGGNRPLRATGLAAEPWRLSAESAAGGRPAASRRAAAGPLPRRTRRRVALGDRLVAAPAGMGLRQGTPPAGRGTFLERAGHGSAVVRQRPGPDP